MPLSEPCSVLNWAAWGPVVTPAPTDEFVVRQADGVTRIETRAQIHTLEVGERLNLPQESTEANPTLNFDNNDGIYAVAAGDLRISLGGADAWRIAGNIFRSDAGGGALSNTGVTVTNPTLRPSSNDTNTGLGGDGGDILSYIVGGIELLRGVETGVAATDQLIIGPAGIIGALATPGLAFSDGDSGLTELVDDNISIICATLEALKIEDPADLAATETSLWLYDDDNGAIQQVTVGIADSGGAGFKLLRITN